MNYLILHFLVTIFLCSKRTFGQKSRRVNNYDIEGFISSLLSSQKFDELADKVADKAVRKIKSFETELNIEYVTQNKNEDESIGNKKSENPDEDNVNNIYERQHDEIETEKPKPRQYKLHFDIDHDKVAYHERPKKPELKEDDNVKPGKINTEALLKEEDVSDQTELSLKYDYLKKRVQQNARDRPVNEQNMHWNNHKVPIGKRAKVIENKDQGTYKRGSHQLNSAEKNTKHEEIVGLRGRKDLNSRGYYNDDEGSIESDSKYKLFYHNHKAHFKSKEREQLIKPHLTFIIDDGAKNSKPYVYESNSSPEKITNQYHGYEEKEKSVQDADLLFRSPDPDTKSDEDYTEVPYLERNTAPGYELGELTTRKRLIRREGDRFYTYLSAPEYEEFHAKLENQNYVPTGIIIN